MSAPSVLLLHGSGARPDVWALQTARFQGAVAPWLADPGDGPFPTTAAAAAERAHEALAGLPAPRAVVGHSLGGAVALELALGWPELVDGLVLITTGARLPVPDSAIERARDDIEAEARRLAEQAFVDPAGPFARRAYDAVVEAGPEALGAAYSACRAHDLRGRLGDVRVPALVIAAGRDPLTPPFLSEELARELPNALLVMVEEASHMAVNEDARAVNLLIAGYLARLELTLSPP